MKQALLLTAIVSLGVLLPAAAPVAVKKNPFGVMVGAPGGMSNELKMKVAGELGVAYYRTAIFTGAWKGSHPEADAAVKAGLKLVLTVRAGDGPGRRGTPQPGGPPKDMAAYGKRVGEILDACHPALLVVENEENSMALFYNGTPSEYHAQLKTAAEAAHARGIKCANGGLVSSLVIALTADQYAEAGDRDKAEAFLRRALDEKHYRLFEKGGDRVREQLQRGKALLKGYKDAGADYVNFHWYADDPEALAEVVRYLEKAAGLPVLCNEMGQQKNTRPEQVTRMLTKSLELGLPIVVWFSMDIPGYGEAKGLTEPDGALRDNGRAFRTFIADRFE
ncbi:MAG: hypothetical protein HY343_03300 [Lentisphaerae bacterium]|nr:hypothetical protein [Lentisphaerota bacterium]